MKRQRGRNRNKNNNRNNNHNNYNRSMDSQGPDVKVRGNASTIYEKYTALARDAKMGGSRVKAENLLQHAEHYLRVMNVQEAAKREAQEAREKAEAERAAKRAENGEDDGENSRDNNRRSNHRNHRNQRHENRKDDVEKTEEKVDAKAEAPAELEVIEPIAETPKSKDVDVEEAPTRRRKAPSRNKAENETSVEAAE